MSKPTRPRRPLIEAIEPRLLFSATADIAVFDDGSHYPDALAQAAAELDLAQVYFSESPLAEVPLNTESSNSSNHSDIAYASSIEPSNGLASNTPELAAPQTLVFVDTSIKDYQTLVADITKNHPSDSVVVMYLDPNQDGINLINHALAEKSNVSSIHILSHGIEGNFKLGNQLINENTVNNYRTQLNSWGNALTENADILIYGCDVAANDSGLRLLQIISDITGADVAASNDDTGKSATADWELEAHTGQIESPTIFNLASDMQWEGTLPNNAPTVSNVLVNQTASVGTAFNYQFASNSFNDADGNTLTYTATLNNGTSLPAWLSFNAATRTFSGTPADAYDTTTYTVRVTANDGNGGSVYDDFVITVTSKVEAETWNNQNGISNEATTDTGGGQNVGGIDAGDWFAYYWANGSDIVGHTGTYTLDWRVASNTGGTFRFTDEFGATTYDTVIVPNTGGWQSWTTISHTVSITQQWNYSVYGVSGNPNINWFMLTPNDTPTVSHGLVDQIATENAAFNYQFIGQNSANNIFEDSDTLTYSATLSSGAALPAWLTFNSGTRTFSGTPTSGDLGSNLTVRLTATDTYGATVYDDFAIIMNSAANDAPVNTVPSSINTNEDTAIVFNQGAGLTGTYYNNTTLTGPAAGTRTDYTVDYYWGTGAPGVAGIGSDNFSVRWSGELHATDTGIYNFRTLSDDGVRVYIDGNLVIENWTGHAVATDTSPDIVLTAGRNYSVVVEYFEGSADSEIKLQWKTPSSGSYGIIPSGVYNGHDAGFYRGNQISVSDIDAGNNDIEVTLAVTGGTLTLPEIANLSFTAGDGTSDTTMTFRGTVANINSALAFLTFNPSSSFSGNAQISMTTNDLGNTGTGGIKTDTDVFNITVNNVDNDAPAGTNATLTAIEDTNYTFSSTDFGFTDPDTGDSISAVRIDTLPASGTLKLSGTNVSAGQVITTAQISNLTFTPAANTNGNALTTFTFSVRDQSSVYDVAPNTITFNVTSVNDAPAGTDKTITTNEDTGYTLTTSDFGFSDASDSNNLSAVKITTLPAVGTLKLNGVDVTLNQVVSASNINSGLLVFAPASNANGNSYTNFTFKVQDDGGTTNGGIDLDPTANTITFNVASVNDAPAGTDKTITTNEDTGYTLTTSDFGFSDASDSNNLSAVKITALPAAGTLKLNGVDVTLNQVVSAANINSGLLVFAPASNANGNSYTNFTFKVQDDGGTTNGGIDLDPTANTITFNVTSVNDAPAGTDKTITTNEDTGYTLTTSDFGFSDASDSNNLSAVKITTLPAAGTLKLNGVDVTLNQVVSASNINSGLLVFAPASNANGNSYANFTFKVQDDGGTTNGGIDLDPTANTITFNVTPINDAPTVANTLVDQNATEDSAFSYQFASNSFNEADIGDMLTYTAQLNGGGALPAWLTFNAATRTFSGTPTNAFVGTVNIDVTADDGHGGTVTDTFAIVVANTNDAPTVANAIPDRNATENSAFSFQFASNTFNDVDAGDTLTYSTQLNGGGALPAWLSFNSATRTFSGTPANIDVGTITIDVTASDSHGGTVTDTFDLVVSAGANNLPTVANAIPNQNATEDSAFNFQFASNTFNDVDVGNTLTYTSQLNGGASLPSWLNFNAGTRTFSGTPTNADVGTITIDVTADDGHGGAITDTFTITIANTNDAPSVANSIANQSTNEGSAFSFQFAANTFADVDVGNTLTYTAELNSGAGLPPWLNFNSATRTFSGMPDDGNVGTITIKVIASDGNGGSIFTTFDLTVVNVNETPFLLNPFTDQTATEDSLYSFSFNANVFADPDIGDSFTYTATLGSGAALPSWLSLNSATRTFSGTPTNSDIGTIAVKLIATDSGGLTAEYTFNLAVTNSNDAPTVANAIPDQNATEDSAFNFQFASNTFNDVDIGDTLTYTAQLNGGGALPAWLSFNAGTRTFSGTPTNAFVGTVNIDVIADDGHGGTVTETFAIVVANTNDAPTVANAIPDQNATQDSAFNFQFASNTFNDIDVSDTLVYNAQLNGGGALPSWLSFNASTRTFSGTPTNSDVGTINIDVTVFDGNGGSTTDTFAIIVANTNDAPTVANAIPDQNATEDSAFNFQFASNTFNDVDVGDTLTYTAQLNGGGALPAWLSFNAGTRTFSGTPTNAFVGTVNIDVIADDSHGGTVTETFAIVVANSNDVPTVANAIPNQNATEDSAFNFQFASNTFNELDAGDTLTYTAQLNGGGALPSWLSFNAATRTFSGTPTNAFVGTVNIDVTADDGHGGTVTDTFAIVVANTNDAPTVANAIPDRNATENSAFSYQFASNTFNDIDAGDTLTYSAQLNGGGALPAWLSFNSATRTFSGTPANIDVGTISVDVIANDGNGGTITDTFALVVSAGANNLPSLANAIPNQNATEDSAFNFQFASNTFNDVDVGDTLTYTAQLNGGGALPSWLSFNAATRTFSGTPTNAFVGTVNIDVTADDGHGGTVTDTFAIVVANSNDVPTVANAIPDQNATENSAFTFQFASNTFSDVDVGDTLTYTAQLNGGGALPSWLSFNAATRTFSGTPSNANIGTISIDVTANDGNGGTITDTFNIVITSLGNMAPTITNAIPDQNVLEDSAFNLQFPSNTFNDVDAGNTLTYSAQLNGGGALPSWLSFNAATRTFSGTPSNANIGTISIDVTADDGHGGTATDTFAIVVANTNDAPTLVNAIPDQNATEDSAFSFQVAANTFSDVDIGDTLTYTAQLNGGGALPSWLSFDSASRTFSGTPNTKDAQSYNIQVVATDKEGMATSTSFALNITNINHAPTTSGIATINALQNSAGDSVDLFAAFADREDQDAQLTYEIISNTNNTLVTQTLIDAKTGKLQLHYGDNQFGSSQITVRATDTQGLSVDTSFTVNVAFVNHAPTSSGISDIQVNQGSLPSKIDLSNVFSDAEDGKNLQYSIVANTNPALLQSVQFDQAAHSASINYNASTFGETTLTLRATDSNGDFVDSQFKITVMPQKPDIPTDNGSIKDPNSTILNPDNSTSGSSNNSNSNNTNTAGGNTGSTNNSGADGNNGSNNSGGGGIVKNPLTDNNLNDKNTAVTDPNLSDNLIGHKSTTDITVVSLASETHEPVVESFDPNRYDRVLQHEANLKKTNDSLSNSHPLISSIILPGDGFSISDAEEFSLQVRKIRQEMDNVIAEEQQHKAILSGLTFSLTTGILIWSLRASSLLLTLMSMLPLWRGIDPLPILEEVEKRKKDIEQQRKDKKAEDKNAKEVGYLFDNTNAQPPKE